MAATAFETLNQISARLEAGLQRSETFVASLSEEDHDEPPSLERLAQLMGDIREEQTSLKHFISMGLMKIREVENDGPSFRRTPCVTP